MKTVLLIEDDARCRAPSAELLRSEGWRVIEAEDGESGIKLAVEHKPEIVLCDLLMPRGNGFQVCRAIRENPDLRATKIIVITGRDFPVDRQNAFDAGADDYLVKPISFARLRAALDNVTGQPEMEQALQTPVDGVHCRLKFWGVRGSIPAPGPQTVFYGGNTSCVEVRADGEIIILDAGTGIRPLGLRLAEEFRDRAMNFTVLISHTHWDHIQGFPFFLPAYNADNKVRILGYEGAAASLAQTLAGQMESPYFPIALKQMPANVVIEELNDMEFSIGAVKVRSCFVNHPGVCVGYRLQTSGGSIAYLPDNEPCGKSSAASADHPPGEPDVFPKTMDKNLIEFIADADVLIIDSQYDESEYSEHVGWGHGCVDDVVALAIAANVKRLYLFHHDPNHNDARVAGMLDHARKIAGAKGSGVEIFAAREGEQIVL